MFTIDNTTKYTVVTSLFLDGPPVQTYRWKGEKYCLVAAFFTEWKFQ